MARELPSPSTAIAAASAGARSATRAIRRDTRSPSEGSAARWIEAAAALPLPTWATARSSSVTYSGLPAVTSAAARQASSSAVGRRWRTRVATDAGPSGVGVSDRTPGSARSWSSRSSGAPGSAGRNEMASTSGVAARRPAR